jgi:hypothetical protein
MLMSEQKVSGANARTHLRYAQPKTAQNSRSNKLKLLAAVGFGGL